MDQALSDVIQKIEELEKELSQPDVLSDQKRYKELTKEHSRLSGIKDHFESLMCFEKQLSENKELLKGELDPSFIELLEQDNKELEEKYAECKKRLDLILVPPGPHDNANTIIEIRAGAGGQEAMLFVADCVRMYQLFAAEMGWKYETLIATDSDIGGYKEYVMVLSGENVYRYMQYEAGTHRVQRVPLTESQGRVHTSTITVAILLEPEESEEISIPEDELRIDVTRSSGAGGQHVNTTDSAVRITHIPTGTVVFCQAERSQHKNKAHAMRVLKAKLVELEERKKKQAIDSTRANQVGTGDRAEKIKTYNFPQNRLTDHRIQLTKYNLDRVLNGDLLEFVAALVKHFQQTIV